MGSEGHGLPRIQASASSHACSPSLGEDIKEKEKKRTKMAFLWLYQPSRTGFQQSVVHRAAID